MINGKWQNVLVRDKITGFIGAATARCVYSNGCVQFEVTKNALVDGKIVDPIWIDEQRLEKLKPVRLAKPEPLPTRRRGGPPRGPSHSRPATRSHPPSSTDSCGDSLTQFRPGS